MKTLVAVIAIVLALAGGAVLTDTASAAAPNAGHSIVESSGPVIGFAPIDEGGFGWNYVAGPVWMNGPYGYGRYCWFFHQWYGHAVFPC